MPADIPGLLADLAAETAVVDAMVARLAPARWDTPTPAAGWAVRDQISHLAHFDRAATLAVTDPQRFRAEAAELATLGPSFPDVVAARYRTMPPAQLLAWSRRARRDLLTAFRAADPGLRLPWYGPDMGVASSITARLMETWAHGQDVADALGVTREPTRRLRHIAHLGVATREFSYRLRGLPAPAGGVLVALTAPDGERWAWGPPGGAAGDSVTGTALDFCLVVAATQPGRHLAPGRRPHCHAMDVDRAGVRGRARCRARPAGRTGTRRVTAGPWSRSPDARVPRHRWAGAATPAGRGCRRRSGRPPRPRRRS